MSKTTPAGTIDLTSDNAAYLVDTTAPNTDPHFIQLQKRKGQ
jgi:hypothetical protein